MKIFIVFFGILIMGTHFVVFQSDMGRYEQAQEWMKALAEDCAAGAALYYEEEAFSEGRMVFAQEDGNRLIESMVGNAEEACPLDIEESFSVNTYYFDDEVGYAAKEHLSDMNYPSVVVEITGKTKDIFRLPFFSVTEIKRSAMYELPY